MPTIPRTVLPAPASTSTATTIIALGCAALLGCSDANGDGAAKDPPTPTRGEGEDVAAYWVNVYGKIGPEHPKYLRLPAGVDTRGWERMHEGFKDSLKHQKNFNRPTSDNYEEDYDFTWDVFTLNVPLWEELLAPYMGKPNLRYLEIGVAEGRSLLWVLDNVLTHPSSRATAIDPFMVPGHEQKLRANLKKSDAGTKTTLLKGFSQDVLPDLEPDSFDLIYIDGSHLAGDVLFDSVYTWRLLKEGGVVIHDDYNMGSGVKPVDNTAAVAIDMFITGRRNTLEILHRGHQLALRKLPLEIPAFCWNRDPCLRIGRYLYAWNTDRVLEVGTEREIQLSENERTVIQELLVLRRIGADAELVLEEDIAPLRDRFPKEFARLETLLDLRVSSPPPPP